MKHIYVYRCQPFAKFLTIKGVVFLTFWQGLAINIIFHASGSESDNDDDGNDSSSSGYTSSSIQHILICMEMLFFSVAHWCVFPAEEWEDGYKARFYEGPGFGFKDFGDDVAVIIDSGKRSMQARREQQNNEDVSDTNAMDDSKQSFGSMEGAETNSIGNPSLV